MKKKQNLSDSKEGRILGSSNSVHNGITKRKSPSPLQLDLFDHTDDILFSKVLNECLPIVQTYQKLISLEIISDSQADLLDEILTLSETNPVLSKLLSKVDENIPLEDKLAREFSNQVKQKIGVEQYQAWQELRFT
jgi:hypothetical protein